LLAPFSHNTFHTEDRQTTDATLYHKLRMTYLYCTHMIVQVQLADEFHGIMDRASSTDDSIIIIRILYKQADNHGIAWDGVASDGLAGS